MPVLTAVVLLNCNPFKHHHRHFSGLVFLIITLVYMSSLFFPNILLDFVAFSLILHRKPLHHFLLTFAFSLLAAIWYSTLHF